MALSVGHSVSIKIQISASATKPSGVRSSSLDVFIFCNLGFFASPTIRSGSGSGLVDNFQRSSQALICSIAVPVRSTLESAAYTTGFNAALNLLASFWMRRIKT